MGKLAFSLIKKRVGYLVLVSAYSFGLDLIPDSISMAIDPMLYYWQPVGTLKIKNSGNVNATVRAICYSVSRNSIIR